MTPNKNRAKVEVPCFNTIFNDQWRYEQKKIIFSALTKSSVC